MWRQENTKLFEKMLKNYNFLGENLENVNVPLAETTKIGKTMNSFWVHFCLNKALCLIFYPGSGIR